MSTTNPRFKRADRPAYELPCLLQILGDPDFTALTDDQRNIIDAIRIHAGNAQEVILDGIASIGDLMTMVDDTHAVSNDGLLSLGALLKHLAQEADNLRSTQSEMLFALKSDDELRSKAIEAKK